ncbi:MAG: hypothetical protein F4171_07870 [Gammaproteobacteria bacterium]|nr:hypothetical protein [Gammaproteobacteria bacterium]MXY06771.1 hypothetical protein [Gammaproteobacteria bacterium]MYE86051.1 hypothetical protein [Gammaproteobacteria bacterium]MYF12012.1 hypothetical protein [Gammaproteobacteria bacterium]MYG12704.1 hypothetical protein [Gammaproteobacteria bacterium]
MNMKHAVASFCVGALLGLASPAAFAASTALAACRGALTDEDYWNCECRQAWTHSEASSTCEATEGGEPRHLRVQNQDNICALRVKCMRLRGTRVSYPISSYEGRSVDVENLRNCDGIPKVGC